MSDVTKQEELRIYLKEILAELRNRHPGNTALNAVNSDKLIANVMSVPDMTLDKIQGKKYEIEQALILSAGVMCLPEAKQDPRAAQVAINNIVVLAFDRSTLSPTAQQNKLERCLNTILGITEPERIEKLSNKIPEKKEEETLEKSPQKFVFRIADGNAAGFEFDADDPLKLIFDLEIVPGADRDAVRELQARATEMGKLNDEIEEVGIETDQEKNRHSIFDIPSPYKPPKPPGAPD